MKKKRMFPYLTSTLNCLFKIYGGSIKKRKNITRLFKPRNYFMRAGFKNLQNENHNLKSDIKTNF